MADNYLENKFEEYAAAKAGRRTPHRVTPSGSRPGYAEFRFPRRRVLVALAEPRAVVEAFCNVGCQVAFCAADGQELAETLGARFCQVDSLDAENICHAMDKLMKAWRDIEIIICDATLAPAMAARFDTLRATLPMAPDYGRIITVSDRVTDLPESAYATVNAVTCDAISKAVANTCLFLSLPDSNAISGQTISILKKTRHRK